MRAEERCFLFLDSFAGASTSDLELRLGIGDWRMYVANSLEDARELVESQHLRIGVLNLEPSVEEDVAEAISDLSRSSKVLQWIALVPNQEAPLITGRCATLVADHFFDYHTLPIDVPRFSVTLGHALGMSRAVEQALNEVAARTGEDEMVGTSPVMLELFRTLRKVAASDAPVFISGESGTGKELAALAIHERSSRRNGPFVAVDCGAIPPTLIQSELFGYEKGAFTGASQRKIGRIESAAGGTVFLDEIGDLPLEMQGNLLRFLQESTIQRVGGTQHIPVDVRVIAATHVDLEEAVRNGTFRQDLLFRLCVLRITTPPLRDRVEDIELLAKYFFESFLRDSGRPLLGFSTQALEAMRAYEWPGNVRELINRIRRAIVMCDGKLITPADMDLSAALSRAPRTISLDDARSKAERQTIEIALRTSRFNMSRAAKSLGVSRVTLYRLMDKHHIVPPGTSAQP